MNFQQESIIFNSLSHPAIVLDPDLNVRAVSEGFIKSFAATREEWVGQNISKFQKKREEIGSKENDDFLDALNSVKKSKKILERPVQRWKLDGENFTYWVPKTTPTMDEKGNLIFILHELRDVTPLVKSEQNLNRLELDLLEHTALTNILDRQSDGFVVVDENLCITFLNKRFTDFVSLNHDDVIGKSLTELFKSEDAGRFIARYKEVIRSQTEIHFQDDYLGRVLSLDAYPAKNGGAAIFFRDVTEKVQHEVSMRGSS